MVPRMLMGLAMALAAVALLTPAVLADKKPVKPTKDFKGSVEDETLAKDAPTVIVSAKGLEKLWTGWKVADKMPEVDFTKELVVLTTSRASTIRVTASLDEKGDLTVGGFGTKDLQPGFRFHLIAIPREGIKTVAGKELPKE